MNRRLARRTQHPECRKKPGFHPLPTGGRGNRRPHARRACGSRPGRRESHLRWRDPRGGSRLRAADRRSPSRGLPSVSPRATAADDPRQLVHALGERRGPRLEDDRALDSRRSWSSRTARSALPSRGRPPDLLPAWPLRAAPARPPPPRGPGERPPPAGRLALALPGLALLSAHDVHATHHLHQHSLHQRMPLISGSCHTRRTSADAWAAPPRPRHASAQPGAQAARRAESALLGQPHQRSHGEDGPPGGSPPRSAG
jgi:hypothetical protein